MLLMLVSVPWENIELTFLRTLTGGILTVADDLLKNDGKKFIEMMEQLAERRMQREEEANNVPTGHSSLNMSVGQNHIGHTHSQSAEYDDEEEDEEEYDEEDYDDDEEDEPVGYSHVLYHCQSTLTRFRIP